MRIATEQLLSILREGVGNKLAWLVLLLGLAFTVFGYSLAQRNAAEQLQMRFDNRAQLIQESIRERMGAYHEVLRGGAGLFDASQQVTREQWRRFVDRLRLPEFYPGIQGIGFTERIDPQELEQHQRRIRDQGFPTYRVWPDDEALGERDLLSAIIYLEPFDWRNRRAFGYDMLSEPTRRRAMLEARDVGRGRLSGKVTLVQEAETDVQAGVLLYLPVYEGGAWPETLEARREALRGWVYSPFRMGDLMHGILGPRIPELQLEVYDGDDTAPDALLYAQASEAETGRLEVVHTIEIAGRIWTLRFTSLARFDARYADATPALLLSSGMLVSLLLFIIAVSLSGTRARAVALANTMTTALRQSEARFRTTFENAAVGIALSDTRDRILSTNPALQRMLGYSASELQGEHFDSFLHPEDRVELDQLLGPVQNSNRTRLKREERYRRKNGETAIGCLTFTVIRGGDGRTEYLLRMLEDITEVKAAQSALQEAYTELEQRVEQRTAELRQRTEELGRSNAELEQFAYVASHDLQEPLRTVTGFAQLLQRRHAAELDAQGQEFLEQIFSGTRRMHELIRDLLAYSRAGRGSTAEVVDLEQVLARACDNLAGAISDSGATLSHDPFPRLCGFKHDLVQLFQNLISNAVKFRSEEAPRIHIGVEARGDEWLFSVSDNGIGMAEEATKRIFDLFQRAEHNHGQPGTGIGLAICEKVVLRHGGRIWAESKRGRGSTFYFTLRDQNEPAEEPSASG